MNIREEVVFGGVTVQRKIVLQRAFCAGDFAGKGSVDQVILTAIICIETAPAVLRRVSADVCFHGIIMDVKQRRQEIFITFNGHAVKTVLKEMTGAQILAVVPADESCFQTLEEMRQLLRWCVKQKMDVVVHQAISIYLDIIVLQAIGHKKKEFSVIGILFKDDMLINGTKYDMIYASRADDSWLSWHTYSYL